MEIIASTSSGRIKRDSAHTVLGMVLGECYVALCTPGSPVGSGIETNDMVYQGTRSNAVISGK